MYDLIHNFILYVYRLLKMKSVPHSVGFCSAKGDLLVGIDNHLYKIPYYSCKSALTTMKIQKNILRTDVHLYKAIVYERRTSYIQYNIYNTYIQYLCLKLLTLLSYTGLLIVLVSFSALL
jgi:hypothetical protein